MKLYAGQKVKIRVYKNPPPFWNCEGKMDKWMGEVVTIVDPPPYCRIKEDGGEWVWRSRDFEEYNFLPDNLFEI